MTFMRILALFLAAAALTAYGQETRPSTETTPSEALRAADAAIEALIDRVLSVRVAAGPAVSVLVSHSTEAELALRRQVAERCHHSDPRTMPDGSTEVDAWIITSDLAGILTSAVAPHVPRLDADLFRLDPTREGYLIATGSGWPSSGVTTPGWRHLSPQDFRLARAAATADARVGLRVELLAILPDGQTLARTIERLVLQAKPGAPVFEPCGVCRVSVELSRAKLAETTKSSRSAFPGRITAIGLAVAPPRVSGRAIPSTSGQAPEWSERTLTARAIGKAPDQAGDTDARRQLATTAARLEAARRLWLQIEVLPLPEGDTVSQRLPANPRLVTQIENAFVVTASPAATEDGSIRIELAVPLTTVWRLLQNTTPDR